LLWIWDSSASELNKISRTNLLTTTDDFNTSYARLNGRSGGQTLIGGTAANDDLTLEGTSSATRTTSYVVLQPNGGNVGIGTTSPASRLHVAGGTSGGFFTTTDYVVGSTGTSIELVTGAATGTTTGQIRVYTAGSSLLGNLVLQPEGGRVGIGTTSPASRLHVAGGTSGGFFTTTDYVVGSTGTSIELVTGAATGATTGQIRVYTAGSSLLGNLVLQPEGGNVGIGTTSPSKKLHVAGTILIDGDEGGIAGTIGLTDVFDATLSSGNGTVKLKGTTTRDSAGFIKMYVGTTIVWVPYWTNIA
jgi:hypothetical protein